MTTQLVEIQPRELKFIFEVKKQSLCAVHLANVNDQYVAFKVKTTSPKKYCVRPNVGIIKPKSTCDFTVTMQAQKSAPSDMQCKDKFLIQSTVVPYGTTEDEITPTMFSKDSQKYIEETKLRVVLSTAPNSPVKSPVDVVLKQEASSYGTVSPKESYSAILPPVNGVSKQEQSFDPPIQRGELQNGVIDSPPPDKECNRITYYAGGMILFLILSSGIIFCCIKVNMKEEALETVNDNKEEPRSPNVVHSLKSVPVKHEDSHPVKDEEPKQANVVEVKPNLAQEILELRSKITAMDAQLVEAHRTIEILNSEKSGAIHEKETLKQQLATLKTRNGGSGNIAVKRIRVGFPPLFVCIVALVSFVLGLYLRA